MKVWVLIFLLFSILVGSCDRAVDLRLQHIQTLIEKSPKEALDSLNNIERSSLSESNRHLYDFLTIKVSDKAYVRHTSDSLVAKVIEYESSHRSNGRYAEALYYGGRVHSDMGDYPVAMEYYQDALDAVGSDYDNNDLKASIVSQYGRLLAKLRLYDEAIPHIETAIGIDRIRKDSINLIYDLQLLGTVLSHTKKYDESKEVLFESLDICVGKPIYHEAKTKVYLADVYLNLGEIDSALNYVRETPDKVKPLVRNSALSAAAKIYLKAGIIDTASLYAREIIESSDQYNKPTGYQVLLSPDVLKNFSDIDTMRAIVSEYRKSFEKSYDENSNTLSLYQQSIFNYKSHVDEKEKAMEKNMVLNKIIFNLVFLILLIVASFLFILNRNKNHIIRLQSAIARVSEMRIPRLEEKTSINPQPSEVETTGITEIHLAKNKETPQELRKKLRESLLSLHNEGKGTESIICNNFTDTETYKKINKLAKEGKALKDDDPIWEDIEKMVLNQSPMFKENLKLLAGGKFSSYDLHTALLIKIGISPSNMAIIFNRAKGTIVSRRESLCERIFDNQLGTKTIDGIIRLL